MPGRPRRSQARPAPFERLGGFVSRHPRKLIGGWAALVAALAFLGSGVDGKLLARAVVVEGSVGQRAHEIAVREFGQEHALVVVLQGPHASVVRQGHRLERQLEAMPGVTTISPWDRGGPIAGLMPGPRTVGLVVSAKADSEDPTVALPPIQKRINESVTAPVRTSVAGAPAISESFINATEQATAAGERLALPLLLIVLLLVFRSVVAAAIPLLIGGAVVASTRGVVDLLLAFTQIEFLALGAIGMMGLALGVDYSLLMVSRFREESEGGIAPAEAARRTVATTGPTVAAASAGLSLAMAASAQLLSESVVASVAIAVIAAAVMSVLSALLVTPALLVLLGPKLERWSLPARRTRSPLLGWTRRLSGNRRAAALPAIVLLFIGAILATTLDTRFESVGLLPADDPGRQQQERVQDALGEGWVAPYEIVMAGGDGPVTTPSRLKALAAFQRRVESDPGVATMAGFSEIERSTRPLGNFEGKLLAQRRGLRRLDQGISRLHGGTRANTDGLLQAAGGAQTLGDAIGATQDGATQLARGLRSASGGSERLAAGLDRASAGGEDLARGMEKVTTGANRLSSGLARAQERSGELTTSAHLLESAMSSGEDRLAEVDASIHAAEARLAGALEALRGMTTGRSDPRYAAALEATEGAHASLAGSEPGSDEGETASPAGAAVGVARARGQFSLGLYLAGRLGKSGRAAADGLAKLARGSARLDRALSTLAGGSRQVDQGLARLAAGGQRLPPGLNRLSEGATRLGSGLGLVETGAGALAGGLGDGAQRSRLLSGGLSKIGAGVARQRGAADDAPALRDRSPRLFRSGYLYLAALDGSSPQQRQRAALLVNINRGGRAARMIVIPRRSSEDAGAAETRQRLEGYAGHLARQTGTNVLVGGASASQLDANSAFRGRSAFARLALALITILILVPVMRSLTIPLIAALLNVLTVAATFGLMALAFNDSLLGGPGYVDAAVVPATIVVIFGLAIDYEVFIFARIREEYERSGSTDEAIARGLGRTAPVVTGAALIMIVVFLSFATSSFSTDRDFGTAQAIAVAIDAFIIRLIVVPALMRSMGPWAWWLPRWLDRLLPRGRKTAQARSDPRAASVQPATLPVAPLDD